MVGVEVFVVVVVGDLEVFFDVVYYQQLFEQLWGLGQCVLVVGVQVSGYQEVMGVFGCGVGEGGCFDFGEVVGVQYVVDCFVDV